MENVKIVGSPLSTLDKVSVDLTDVKVQRKLNPKRALSYISKVGAFDWRLFGVVTVVEYPDGRQERVNGQHKSYMAKETGIDEVPALIYNIENEEEASKLFHRMNGTCSANVNPEERFVAQYHGGEAEALLLYEGLIKCNAYVESNGNKVGKDPHGKAIKIGKWKDLYTKHQPELVNACSMIWNNGLWNNERSYNTMFLMGLVELQRAFKKFDADFYKYQDDFEKFLGVLEMSGIRQTDLTYPQLRKDNHYGISVAWGLYQAFYNYLTKNGRHTPFAKKKLELMYLDAGSRN